MQPLGKLRPQGPTLEDDQPQKSDDTHNQADDPGQGGTGVADGQHDVGHHAHADVQQKVDQTVFGKLPVDKSKQKIQHQGGGAQDGNCLLYTSRCV